MDIFNISQAHLIYLGTRITKFMINLHGYVHHIQSERVCLTAKIISQIDNILVYMDI